MSALELNDHEDPLSISYYAPRRRHVAGNDATIRPVLARLRGEDGGHPLVESVPLMPSDQPIGIDGADARQRLLWIAARFAAVTALCAGATAVTYLVQTRPQEQARPQREARAPAPPTALPKPVQTVSFKSQARLGDAIMSAAGVPVSSAETRGQPLRDSAAEVVGGPQAETTAAAPAPLASPGAMPAALSPAGWSPAATDVHAETEPAATTVAPDNEHGSKEHHTARVRHHYRHRHHHVARATEPPQPSAEASAAQPAQTSLGDFLRKIFKSSSTETKTTADAIR